jgi:hypothetical protein
MCKTLGPHSPSVASSTPPTTPAIPRQPRASLSSPRYSLSLSLQLPRDAIRMASNSPYPDPDQPMGGAPGLYGNQNGNTPPAQQQQHMTSDTDLQMQENLAQLQRSNDLMQHPGGPGQQMNPLSAAHHHFHSPPRPTHSPQQMAQTVMNLEDHNIYGDHENASRKRSKVSRACDECRRKKVCWHCFVRQDNC